jgi:hypothetical protein
MQARVGNLTLYVCTQCVTVDKGLWSTCLGAATQAAPVEIFEFF